MDLATEWILSIIAMYSARVRSHLPEEEVQKTFDALVDNLRQHQLDKVEELLAIVPPADARYKLFKSFELIKELLKLTSYLIW